VQRESENPAQPWPRVILDDHSRAVASLLLFVEAQSAFENADIAAQMFYSKWRADRLFLLLPAGALVQQWLKSLAEFPPSVGGEIDFWAACMRRASSMELVPMAEFTIVTRSSSSAWIPELIAAAGAQVTETYIDFFTSTIRNRNTRAAYARACWQFFDWCGTHGLELKTVRPFHVAAWIEDFPGSKPTIKQKLAAVRMLYDFLVVRQITPSNLRRRVFSLPSDVTPGGQPASQFTWRNDGRLEHAQQMAGHESPRTTKLYDRTKDEITLSEVERIRL
jgi:Phage integrase, N-terminal SAM-like domain